MRHPLTAHFRKRYLDAALLTNYTAVLETLVLPAQALVILDRSEDLGTEQAITLRLEGAIVDCFRLLDFAVRPRPDLVW